MKNKNILVVLIFSLLIFGATKALASLTFTTNTITGTAASVIDLGTGNTLSLQTISNAPITMGTGLTTFGGNLSVVGRIGVGTTAPNNLLQVVGYVNFNNTDKNTLLGKDAGLNIAIGHYGNTAVGYQSLAANTGNINTAVGLESLEFNTGSNNTAVGGYALNSNTIGNSNVAVGSSAFSTNTTGSYNTAIGSQTLQSVDAVSNNTAVGYDALTFSTTGANNTAIGTESGSTSGASPSSDNYLDTGSNNTFVGYESGLGSATQHSNSTALGAGAYVNADNTVVLGNGAVTNVLAGSTSGATVNAGKYKLSALNTAPASASATGTVGEIRWANGYVYLCVAANTWQRAALTSW